MGKASACPIKCLADQVDQTFLHHHQQNLKGTLGKNERFVEKRPLGTFCMENADFNHKNFLLLLLKTPQSPPSPQHNNQKKKK